MQNFTKILQAAQQAQTKMQAIEDETRAKDFTGSAGSDKVTVIMSGSMNLKKLDIDDSILEMQDKEILSDLISAAINNAIDNIKTFKESKASDLKKDMGLPAGMNIPGLM